MNSDLNKENEVLTQGCEILLDALYEIQEECCKPQPDFSEIIAMIHDACACFKDKIIVLAPERKE